MPSQPDPDRLALAQALMAEITARLEDLAGLAADQQRARSASPALLEGLLAVEDLARAHARLLPPRKVGRKAGRTAGPRSGRPNRAGSKASL
jgi:hypothetical protein